MRIEIFLGALFIWNSYVFITMGRDKRLAKLGSWRIPEFNLLLMGFALGGFGLYSGMRYFHHKTHHKKFVIGAPICILVNLLMLGYVMFRFYYI
ncbi:DUF1294 domain-containing protein [Desulfosporosinus sp. I2]|uniref:DUF1294 domain-containing protein n=1 Tax=Desulfosporosinus sp. I2 TaxID=1617025 RepID=UPI0005EDD0FC|nr:DUF1294 domain-containing protein [Desulfosporosinus sp. I2]